MKIAAKSLFPSLKLRSRILAIAATTLVGMGVIAAIYLKESTEIRVLVAQERETSHEIENLGRAGVLTEASLVAILELAVSPTLETIGKAEVAFSALSGAADNYKALPEVQAEMLSIPTVAKTMMDRATTLGLDENSGLKGALRGAVHNIEDILKKEMETGTDLDSLMVQMLMLRRNEKDFMLRGSDKYRLQFDESLAKFNASLENTFLSSGKKNEIRDFSMAYQQEFGAFVDGTNDLKNAYETASTQIKLLSDLISQPLDSYAATRDELLDRIENKWAAFSFVLIATIIVAALISLTLSLVIGISITKPIAKLTQLMGELAGGKLDVVIDGAERSDELGEMARAVEVFKQNGIERQRLEGQSEAEQRLQAERQQKVDALIASFRGTVGEALRAVAANTEQMSSTANNLTTIANETSGQTNEAANASESASQNVQAVAAAAEELAASIEEISRQVSKTNSIVNDANAAAHSTNEKVTALASAAQKIGDVISLIQDIAEQTNLLALNTSIEAARAGEAGKGFAVVASEVKNLANQTATATEEISSQIANIQSSTTDAVAAIEEITRTMAEVNSYTASIASAVEEQGAATAEISQSVAQAATSTKKVVGSMAIVTSSVGETNASASQVLSASEDVSTQAKTLRDTVDMFLSEVAAA